MYQQAHPLFMYCETPLHVGSGSELGTVDLPIQREKHTGFPKIEASSLKGALRERCEQVTGAIDHRNPDKNALKDIYVTFGPEGEDGLHAGALGFTDARLLLFPVKSMRGVFGWVTCPRVLHRFARDLGSCGLDLGFKIDSLGTPEMGKAIVQPGSSLLFDKESDARIALEAYTFAAETKSELSNLSNWLMQKLFAGDTAWQRKIGNSLVLLSDEDFTDFVTMSTEVITRVKIDNHTGTVADGALFTEEYLPSESVLYSLVLAAPVFPVVVKNGKEIKDRYVDAKRLSKKQTFEESDATAVAEYFRETLENKAQNHIQVGGNATLGKGLMRTTLLQGKEGRRD